jgi:hypothetical protein
MINVKKMTTAQFEEFIQYGKALGGYWIRPDGVPVPVLDHAEHSRTLERELHTRSYDKAYRKGYIRVGLCSSYEFDVDIPYEFCTEANMDTLIRTMRFFAIKGEEYRRERQRVVVELKEWNRKEDARTIDFRVVTTIQENKSDFGDFKEPYLAAASKLSRWWTGELKRRKALEPAPEPLLQAA